VQKETHQDIVTPSEWILENGLWAVWNQTQISKEYNINKMENKKNSNCALVKEKGD